MSGHLGMDLFVDQVRQRVGTSVFWSQGKGPIGQRAHWAKGRRSWMASKNHLSASSYAELVARIRETNYPVP